MGLGIGDFDTDGHLDIFKTHFRDDTHVLYRNNGKGIFRDVTLRARAWAWRRASWDGARPSRTSTTTALPDLFFTTGMVYPEVEAEAAGCAVQDAQRGVSQSGRRANSKNCWTKPDPAMAEVHSSRGVAFGDFDNDGDIDILIMNMNEPPSLLRNDVSGSESLAQGAADRRGIEPQRDRRDRWWLTYGERRQAQAVLAQSSYLSVNDRRLHFGLGAATTANLEIRWPNGAREKVADVAADQLGGDPRRRWNREAAKVLKVAGPGVIRALYRPDLPRFYRPLLGLRGGNLTCRFWT